MKPAFLTLFILLIYGSATAQSGGVLKGGLLWKDFERDNKSVLAQSASGFMAGIEVRLGAEEKTYFKPAAYISRIQANSQQHFDETQFFKIKDGYDVVTGMIGLETRLIDAGSVHWRLAFSGLVDYIVNVRGNITYEDLTSVVFGVQLSSGIDIGILAVDVGVQRGINALLVDQEDSHAVVLTLTAGLSF